jgi:hypothetical protein
MENNEREEWLVHIAHDVGALGEKNAFKIIDSITKGEERVKVRKIYLEVIAILKSSEEYDKPLNGDD